MDKKQFNNGLIEFLNSSMTPFHAVQNMANILLDNGFEMLQEQDRWSLQIGQKYFVTRGDSSIIAFAYTQDPSVIIGAHTDSPVLKIKPNSKIFKEGVAQLAVEPYGGLLLNPWFDRDLSIAGIVYFTCKDAGVKSALIDFKKAVAFIPSLAIHLDANANENKSINKQTDMSPVVSLHPDFDINEEIKKMIGDDVDILSYDLSLYDVNKTAYVGFYDEFITGARLDNLLSCYAGTQAICHGQKPMMLVCSNHEEVGSVSAYGADGSFMTDVMHRIYGDAQTRIMAARDSMFISCDNAHALHPNFTQKYDPSYAPKIGKGVVIKINSNQRYATSAKTASRILKTAKDNNIQTQLFLTRSDMGCGSTIGPISAARLGIDAIDIGVPTYAMHSIRESCGTEDTYTLYKLLVSL